MRPKEKLRLLARDIYKTWTLKYLYPKVYRKEAAKRTVKKNKIVFAEVRTKDLSDSFTSVLEALERKGGYEIATLTLREGMESRRKVRERALLAIKEFADAAVIFTNDSSYLLGAVQMRPETKLIQLWHACGAFKKFGYSIADKKFGSTKAELDRYPMYRNFTYVTVSSPEVKWAYAEAFGLETCPERFADTGIARTDIFYDEDKRKSAREKLSGISAAKGKKIILYAPTFRGSVASAASPEQLDMRLLRDRLGDDYVLLINHHPFVKNRPDIPDELKNFAADVTGRLNIEELLMAADVCVTDYSSLIFEYSLMERPVAFFAPDIDEYDDWRGFYYPYEEMTPGPVFQDTSGLAQYIRSLDEGFDKTRIRAFKEKFMSSCDGHATERILRLLDER